MSGIFNSDSIYKSGGGGGFKNGGQLVDGDFIKVENNTVSSYDNVSRDPVNFYFEVKDGEILNSVVELTTAVNATVNVYVLKNNLYYIIGNVGGNTITYNNTYQINIIGDSFIIDTVTPPLSNDPVAAEIDGGLYGIVKIGNTYWTDRFVKINQGSPVIKNDVYYYGAPLTVDGWRIPNDSEFAELSTIYPNTYNVKSTNGWSGGGGNGDNASGLNLYPNGYLDPYTTNPLELGRLSCFLFQWGSLLRIAKIAEGYVNANANPAPIRLVHPA